MKLFIVLALLVAAAVAAPAGGPEADAQVTRYNFENIGTDGFSYQADTSNGISLEAQGQLTNPGTENEAIEIRGRYSFLAPDGVIYEVIYTADKDGFHPTGAHLPKSP